MQVLLDAADGAWRRVQILSKQASEPDWTLHAEARLAASAPVFPAAQPVDIEALKAGLSSEDLSAYYRGKAALGIDLGPAFRTLTALWSRPGEALAEVALPAGVDATQLDIHPLLLDGCFQAVGAARPGAGGEDGATYLPFAWDRMQLASRLPERLFCHVRIPERPAPDGDSDASPRWRPRSGERRPRDLRRRRTPGRRTHRLRGETSDPRHVAGSSRRNRRVALRGGVAGERDAHWHCPGGLPAVALPDSRWLAGFSEYLGAQGVDARERPKLFDDLSLLARRFALDALDQLGWHRASGETVEAEALRERLGVLHRAQPALPAHAGDPRGRRGAARVG